MAQYSLALLLTLGAIAASAGLYFVINRYRPIHTPEPVSDTSIARTATRVIRRHRANAAKLAAERAAASLRAGDTAGAETWERIRKVVESMLTAKLGRAGVVQLAERPQSGAVSAENLVPPAGPSPSA